MKWLRFWIFFVILCVVLGVDLNEPNIQNTHQLSEIDQQGWAALKAYQSSEDPRIPQDSLQEAFESKVLKRRRLRKRKRRPTPPTVEELSSEDLSARRTTESDMNPLNMMADESARRPNVRRRVPPTFAEENVEESHENTFVKFSDEFVDEVNTKQQKIYPDLKSVLKQSSTGSLSEVLQQKNLSLSELLMGNQRAISALTETPQEVTESVPDTTKYKRLPPSVGLRKSINRNYDQEGDSLETLSTKETLEAQRKRLSLLGHKGNRLFSTVTKYDVVTEPTTDRRIFVPSHPKYYTSVVFRPDFIINDEQTTEPITSTTPKTIRTENKHLPITNAKITKLATTALKVTKEEEKVETENYPIVFNFPKPIPIDIQEVFGYDQKRIKETKLQMDEPLRISLDLDVTNKPVVKLEEEIVTKTTTTSTTTTTTTENIVNEKVPHATAKDEIMEILKDPISRERLSRILETRNMTLGELVEQRERGSSQLHLADIFHNKTREPEPKGEPFIGTVSSEYFNSFPLFGRQQKSRVFDDEVKTVPPSSSTTEQTTPTPVLVTSFPSIKIEGDDDKKQLLWSKLQSNIFTEMPSVDDKGSFSGEELQRLEDVDARWSLASHEKLDVAVNSDLDEEGILANIPSGVKSAVFVSMSIICLSIIVFLTILLVFKWTQRQNKKINYCSSLSTKMKSPMIIQSRPTSALKSFMTETLGRKKNYYKSNVQSAEDLWHCDRERIPSF